MIENNRTRKIVPKFVKEDDETVRILLNFCTSKMNRIGAIVSRNSPATKPWEGEVCS